MRHFEDFEIEHLLNHTGGIIFRMLCCFHLKRCVICRGQLEKVIADRNYAKRIKKSISSFPINHLTDEFDQ